MIALPSVSLALPSDALRIAEMSREYIEYGLGWSWTGERIVKAIHDAATNVAIVREHEVLLAFGIMSYGDQKAHLALLAVAPAHRKRGLGALLIAWLEKCASVAGLERVQLEARADNFAAIEFYQGQGYRLTGSVPGYYRGMVDAMRLEKLLGTPPVH